MSRASTIGRRFVDAAAHLRHDLVDDPEQVPIVAESDAGEFEQALALDIDLLVAVDQNVRDRRVLQQRLERTETETSSRTSSEICCFSKELSSVGSLSISEITACRTSVRTR